MRSNPAWAIQLKAAKAAADKLRNIHPSAATTPPPEPGEGEPTPTQKRLNRGEQAYVELAAHLAVYINVLTKCTGYAPRRTRRPSRSRPSPGSARPSGT